MPPLDYGSETYIYLRDSEGRLRTHLVRTIRPHAAETNSQFEERMDAMAKQLRSMRTVASVTLRFERKADRLTLCEVTLVEAPRPVPIIDDTTPTGA